MEPKSRARWTDAELKIVKDIKVSGRTIKDCQHLLPERTLCAIKQTMIRLPGGRKKRGKTGWVFGAMKRALTETPGLTNKQLAHVVGCTRRGIDGVVDVELGTRIYVSGWVRSGTLWTAKYSLGNLPNVPKPPLQSHEERCRKDRLAYRARRASGINPFATAAGFVQAPSSPRGRVFAQDMSGESLEDRPRKLKEAA